MSFKCNYSKINFLLNKPIVFTDNEKNKSFSLRLPTVEDVYTNHDLAFYIEFLELDLSKIQEWVKSSYKLTSHYDFVLLISTMMGTYPEADEIAERFLSAMRVFLPDIQFKNKLIYVNEEIKLSPTLFNDINEIVFESMGKELIVIKETDDEMTKIEKERKLMAKRIRAKAKYTTEVDNTLEDMLVAILYEYQQYKLEDLFKLNVYTLHFLFKYIGKIANYEVSQIAAGFGTQKKHKYFIDK